MCSHCMDLYNWYLLSLMSILQMITVLWFLTLKTKVRIKVNAQQNMSNVLMPHGPTQLVCKFIIFNVYLSNNKIYDCK